MNKYCLVTTYYCNNCNLPPLEEVKNKLNYDGDLKDLFINFSNSFDPWNIENIKIQGIGRKDLIYGKIFMLRDFIKENILGKYLYVCHIDFTDTRFCRSYLEMMETFEASEKNFIISTELKCWPNLETVKTWVNYTLEEKDFEYINSGALISKTETLCNYLDNLCNLYLQAKVDYWDDQGVWQYYNLNIEKLNKDNLCEYFFSTAFLNESFFSIESNKIKTKFNTFPFLIHDNSSFSLNIKNLIK